jgi:hypothetical protein
VIVVTNPKLEQAVADAKVTITDVNIGSINTASGLRVKRHLDELARLLAALEKHRRLSWLGRLQDAMFDTAEDRERDEAVRQVINLTYQLNNCRQCRCVTCPIIDDGCQCEGCLYGSRVTDCPGGLGTETRQLEKGVLRVDGQPVVRAEFDRKTRQTTIVVLEPHGIERRYWFDLRTGDKRPV